MGVADVPNPEPHADSDIQFFFTPPHVRLDIHKAERAGAVSVLYLLRRELLETAGHDPELFPETVVTLEGVKSRMFATMILCFTVIDLLAKFSHPHIDGVGARFRAFLESPEGGHMHHSNSSLLWAARNSLVHQFNVPPEESLAHAGLNAVGFGLRKENQLAIGMALTTIESRGEQAMLYADGLFSITINAIEDYHQSLWGSGSGPNRLKFLDAFNEFGTIRMM
jgi:hypothetical protein